MKEAALILIATAGFGAAALAYGLPASQPPTCQQTADVVRYLPIPEPTPVEPLINLLWPVMERGERIRSDELTPVAGNSEKDNDDTPRATHPDENRDDRAVRRERHRARHVFRFKRRRV